MSGRTPLFRLVSRALAQSTSRFSGTRRQFIQGLGAAGAGAALASCASSRSGQDDAPIAIVGAGVAGLTAAYRLTKKGRTVHLFEASQRWGGRMFTRKNFNADGQFVELGAELVDTGHQDLIRLAKELGLKMQNLVKGETGHDYYWFDGQIRTEEDMRLAFRPLGERIAADAEGLYDADGNFTQKARRLDQISLADYLAENSTGVEPWAIRLLIAAYEPELGVEAERQSSLNLIDFINPDTSKGFQVFGDSDEAYRIAGGNSSLTDALHAAISGKANLRFGQRLRSIQDLDGQIRLEFLTEKGPAAYTYDRVILAIPFTVLRGVSGIYDLNLSDFKKRCIREMGYGNNVKTFSSFARRVWRDKTNAPLAANGSVFSDASTFQNVWETSRGQQGDRGVITNLLCGPRAASHSNGITSQYLSQLDAVFPGLKAAYDGKSGSMNWPKVPTALGSYSAPLVGQYTWIYNISPEPELNGRLLFAGEHTSAVSPGFMNGGVESGNRVARELLQLT
jgi:monoamine oxidase